MELQVSQQSKMRLPGDLHGDFMVFFLGLWNFMVINGTLMVMKGDLVVVNSD